MSDPSERARHFRDRAAEFERLAALAATEVVKADYQKIAAEYIALAEAEELEEKERGFVLPREVEE